MSSFSFHVFSNSPYEYNSIVNKAFIVLVRICCNYHNINMCFVVLDGSRIRLVGGNNSCSGRVEILYKGQWGTVCDDMWDIYDTDVVCRQSDCGKAIRTDFSVFGMGSGPIWLDDVQCTGGESDITQCKHRGFQNEDCNHNEDIGVTCSGI